MRLNQIRDFLAVVDGGSLRAASRNLGVSQPAITKSLQLLEAELAAPLLHRNSRGAAPTKAGKVFLARARVIQAELRKASEEMAQFSNDAQGGAMVSIGVSPTASSLLVADALLRLQKAFPRCAIHVVEGVWSSLLPLVRNETLDMAIVLRTPDARMEATIRFKPLYRADMVVVGRHGHPLRQRRHLRELSSASWIMFGPPGHSGLLGQYFVKNGLEVPPVTVQCESYAAALALLTRTDTLGLIARPLLKEPHTGGPLEEIRIAESAPIVTVGLITRAGAPLTPAAAAAAQAVTQASARLAKPR
jgi:LysR family transcriptional regulator of abg operon